VCLLFNRDYIVPTKTLGRFVSGSPQQAPLSYTKYKTKNFAGMGRKKSVFQTKRQPPKYQGLA
jgi:hypothetical protein